MSQFAASWGEHEHVSRNHPGIAHLNRAHSCDEQLM